MKKHCPQCKKEQLFKLFFDITQEKETKIEILVACTKCNKGIWIEITLEEYEQKKQEYENKKRGR